MIAEASPGQDARPIFAVTTARTVPQIFASEHHVTPARLPKVDLNGSQAQMYDELLLELRTLIDEADCPAYVDPQTGTVRGRKNRSKRGHCPKPTPKLSPSARILQFRVGFIPPLPGAIAPNPTAPPLAGPPPGGGFGLGTQM